MPKLRMIKMTRPTHRVVTRLASPFEVVPGYVSCAVHGEIHELTWDDERDENGLLVCDPYGYGPPTHPRDEDMRCRERDHQRVYIRKEA